MRWNPIQDNTYIILVQGIYQHHKFLWRTKPWSCSKEPGTLVAPTSIIRKFHHRHKFHMREAHFFYIRNKSFYKIQVTGISTIIIFYRPHPTGKLHFINRPGCIQAVMLFSIQHPVVVLPLIIERSGEWCCLWSELSIYCIRICFKCFYPIDTGDVVFI